MCEKHSNVQVANRRATSMKLKKKNRKWDAVINPGLLLVFNTLDLMKEKSRNNIAIQTEKT